MVSHKNKVSISGITCAMATAALGLFALSSMPALAVSSSFVIFHSQSNQYRGAAVLDVTRSGNVLNVILEGESKTPVAVRFWTERGAREAAEDMRAGQALDLSGCAEKEILNTYSSGYDSGNYRIVTENRDYTLRLECDGLGGGKKTVSIEAGSVKPTDLSTRPLIGTDTKTYRTQVRGMDSYKM